MAALTWKHFPTGPNGFFRAPVLLTGSTEALLIDGGFSYADGRALADAIKATGKALTAIYVSQSDPDYYFSLKPVRQAFPDVKVLAASETIAAIRGNVEKKLAAWGPQLKENGPQTIDDIVMPDPFDGAALALEGETIEIIPAAGLSNRRHLWAPSLGAVFGGVQVFAGVHVWTADTAGAQQRAAWLASLDKIADRKPRVVVPGHLDPAAATDVSAIVFTKTISSRLRGRTGQGQRCGFAQGRNGSPLSQAGHGRSPRHRLEGRHRRDEVGLTMTDNIELVRRTYAGDPVEKLRALEAVVAPDIEWTEAAGFPYAGAYRGLDAITKGVFHRLGTEWGGNRATPTPSSAMTTTSPFSVSTPAPSRRPANRCHRHSPTSTNSKTARSSG